MPNHRLVRLRKLDGSWDGMVQHWSSECAAHGEMFEQYASATIATLESLVEEEKEDAGVFAFAESGSKVHAILQANSTHLPGYEGRVLRVRHLITSPAYDFGDFSVADYSRLLSSVFARVVSLSAGEMPSDHIKMHLRSPADIQFFRNVGQSISQSRFFSAVTMHGAWLYFTKTSSAANALTGRSEG